MSNLSHLVREQSQCGPLYYTCSVLSELCHACSLSLLAWCLASLQVDHSLVQGAALYLCPCMRSTLPLSARKKDSSMQRTGFYGFTERGQEPERAPRRQPLNERKAVNGDNDAGREGWQEGRLAPKRGSHMRRYNDNAPQLRLRTRGRRVGPLSEISAAVSCCSQGQSSSNTRR